MDTSKKFVITINRELGSGGRTVGRKLAERLGVKYYDKALIEELTKKFNLTLEKLEQVKGTKPSWWKQLMDSSVKRYDLEELYNIESNIVTSESIFRVEEEFLKDLAAEESCVIAGRSGFYIFRNEPNALKIMIQSSMEKRVERVMNKQNVSEKEARRIISEVDKQREHYTKLFSGASRYDTRNYDLVINVAGLSEEDAVDIIMEYMEKA